MIDRHCRDALLLDIRSLSDKFPVAYLQLIQGYHGNGAAEGSITINPFEVFLEHNLAVVWPVAEIRALWLRSVGMIPDATAREGEPDAGFKEWIWSNTQRRWTSRYEIGYAIDPYMMWQSALATGHAAAQVVNSNPRLATAIEITRIADYADEISRTAERCEDAANQSRQTAEESCRVRDVMDFEPASQNCPANEW